MPLIDNLGLKKKQKPSEKINNSEIWAMLECHQGKLNRISLELISAGKQLAKKSSSDFAVLIEDQQLESLSDISSRYGIKKIYQLKGVGAESAGAEALANLLTNQIQKHLPSLVLFGSTQKGDELSLRISAALGLPLVSHCESLDIKNDKKLVATRPVYGGNFSQEILGVENTPVLASINPRKWDPEPAKMYSDSCNVIELFTEDSPLQQPAYEVLKTIRIKPQDVELPNADVVVGGGKGLGSAENFKNIEVLAKLLNGVIGGSRVAVCNGWVSTDRQIGQSGKTISPRLYIACGISGATHHQMGIKDSELIMAINTDKNAPIFKLADVGAIGDVNEFLPEIIKGLRFEKENAENKK